MESFNWMWNNVVSTAETVKKRAVTVRDWMWGNKGKTFAIFATISTLIYFITLVRRKRNYSNLDIDTQTPQARNAQFRSKMQSYYENAQRGSNNTVNLLTATLRDKLEATLEIPTTTQLRSTMNKSNEEKVAIWDNVKLLTFTRTVSAVYGISLLFLFLRTKVNILGRYLYLDSSITLNSTEESNPITEEIQKKYLIYSDYFLNSGISDLVSYIQKHAEQELAMWPLTRKCTFEDVLTILTNIRVRLEEETVKVNLYQFLLPQESQMDVQDKQLLDLLNETRDVLESDQFGRTLRSCLNASFISLANQIRESFIANTPPSTAPVTSPNPGVALPMAKIIPLLNQKFRMLLETYENKTSLLHSLFTLREVDEYSNAIFTSSYDEE